jgi:hypothetical protein
VLAADLKNIILVGHSYAGCVISGVAEQMLPAMASIVFVDAFLPEDGQRMLDLTPVNLRAAAVEAQSKGEIVRPIVPAAAFKVNEQDQAWVNSKLTPQPLGPSFTPNKFTGARERVAKKTYIRALGYPMPSFDKWLEQCKADPTWRTHGIMTSWWIGPTSLLNCSLSLFELLPCTRIASAAIDHLRLKMSLRSETPQAGQRRV